MNITLTSAEEEALRGLLGDILDGASNFNGTILRDIESVYEKLTHALKCECGCPN